MAYERLPIFPLPDVVLFPHALLPLHVFEPRYRAMTRDVLAADRVLSIVRLQPGFERDYEGRPPVFAVGAVGEVVDSQALPDGRYNILLRGVARVRIEREHPPDLPYRVVQARQLHDEYGGADLGVAATALRALADRLAASLPEGGEVLRGLTHGAVEPGALADVLAAAVVVDPDGRQDLLETLDVAARIGRVSDAIGALLGRVKAPPGGAPPAN